MFLFSPLSFVSAASLQKEKGDEQKTPRAFEAGLSTKDPLNQFTTRNRTPVLLRNISQRSTEKGSLEAEAGDVSILKMDTENSGKACARQLLQGQQCLSAPRPSRHRPFKEGQNPFSRHESQISQLPSPGTPILSASTRPTMQWPPAENKRHWGGPSWASASTICKFHRRSRQRQPQAPLNLKNRDVRGRLMTSAGPPRGQCLEGRSVPPSLFRSKNMILPMYPEMIKLF